eukprot:CAMPEP_0117435514 /NCGR_PEP_ID=MMETSP0759-20121206/522_1 /TAXON_ID=63605 /ORGANISM="Percolomonas cosmopolitus, Strain WS" /LENGTH=1144 /DNA_ID=CAMNT_0005227067 /DNA_START=6 /DNA_END=3442 /DNA_ORIENTATION=-
MSQPSLNIRQYYNNKTLFLTGCTGFVGKVLLYKLVGTTTPKCIYLTIRSKKGTTIEQRLEKEIFQSKMFQSQDASFLNAARRLIKPVEADITDDFLFTGPQAKASREKLAQEVEVVIHCAATVSFFERLDIAINLNVYGTMKKFARECRKLNIFNYISTMFSNSNQPNRSTIYERLYTAQLPNGEDIEAFCKRVRGLSPEEVSKVQKEYLKTLGFPNTYTFTKNMSERLVERTRNGMSVCICRPSIVGASYRDPVPGWVDTVSAAGAIYFFIGLGVTSVMWLDEDAVTDQIPVDYVCNAIIAASADTANTGDFRVFALGSSDKNPVTWGEAHKKVLRYFQSHPPKKSKWRATTSIIRDKNAYITQFMLDHTWMNRAYGTFIRKITGSKKHQDAHQILEKRERQTLMVNRNFSFFCTHGWRFDNSNLERVRLSLSPEEQDIYLMDLKKIDWNNFFAYFCWGLHTFVMGENPAPPFDTNIVDKDDKHPGSVITDVNFAYYTKSSFKNKRPKAEVQRDVLASTNVQNEIRNEAGRTKKPYSEIEQRAREITAGMFADPSLGYVKSFSYLLRKIWRRLYYQIVVDDDQVERLRKLQADPKTGPIVFIPTHRSYIDFLIMSYVFFAYDLPMPHIAAGEDFLNMFLVRDLFRYSGAFFLRRSFSDDPLYKSIFQEYVEQLLTEGCPLEFFVEGTRSRAGKTLQPKLGLLSIIANAHLSGKLHNVTIVPINISYERILESEAYSRELQGNSKTKESLTNLLKARNVIKNKYGDIYIKFASPISLRDYIEQEKHMHNSGFDPKHNADDKMHLVRDLGYRITYSLNEASVIMPTSIVSTLMLRYREGLGKDELIEKVLWLKDLIKERGGRVHWDAQKSDVFNVNRSIQLLGNVLFDSKAVVEPNVRKEKEWDRYIQMGNARNGLLHVFVREAIIATAHHSVGDNDVPRATLVSRAEFLRNVLHVEFIYRPDDRTSEEDLVETLNEMIKRGILRESNGNIQANSEAHEMYTLLCSMMWSFVDAYWIAAMTLVSLKSKTIEAGMLLGRIHWLCEKLYKSNEILFYECSSMDTVKNTVQTFINSKVLRRVKKDNRIFYEVVPSSNDLNTLCDRIRQFRTEESQYRQEMGHGPLASLGKEPLKDRLKSKWRQIRANL